jgi:hypothetical protein
MNPYTPLIAFLAFLPACILACAVLVHGIPSLITINHNHCEEDKDD